MGPDLGRIHGGFQTVPHPNNRLRGVRRDQNSYHFPRNRGEWEKIKQSQSVSIQKGETK